MKQITYIKWQRLSQSLKFVYLGSNTDGGITLLQTHGGSYHIFLSTREELTLQALPSEMYQHLAP